jgi:hypothetical protein
MSRVSRDGIHKAPAALEKAGTNKTKQKMSCFQKID